MNTCAPPSFSRRAIRQGDIVEVEHPTTHAPTYGEITKYAGFGPEGTSVWVSFEDGSEFMFRVDEVRVMKPESEAPPEPEPAAAEDFEMSRRAAFGRAVLLGLIALVVMMSGYIGARYLG